jgi:regulator of cell morphogenesis and NO signaling
MDSRVETISNESFVTDLVLKDYRTSDIFRKYNISYCCGGKISLQAVCEMHKIDIDLLKNELNGSMRTIQVSSSINFDNWSIDFIVDYIINVNHYYLAINLPEITDTLRRFAEGHQSKYPYLADLVESFNQFSTTLLPHLEQEEKVIFPYIKQLAHAYESKEPYAGLLVRTLRKSIESMVTQEEENIENYLSRFRELTDNYTAPSNACITHKVALSKLKELDSDLVHHIYLEKEILFPKAIRIEKELKK